MCCPVYLLVIRGGEQTSRETTRGSAHAVYVPAEFHLPLMKLFVFMTSSHPGEQNETWHQFSIPRVSASPPPRCKQPVDYVCRCSPCVGHRHVRPPAPVRAEVMTACSLNDGGAEGFTEASGI